MKTIKYHIVILFFVFIAKIHAFTGKVVDVSSKEAISGAIVQLKGSTLTATTDNNGFFSIPTNISELEKNIDYKISLQNNVLSWNSRFPIYMQLVNINGQNLGFNKYMEAGSGSLTMPTLPAGIYLIAFESNGQRQVQKISILSNSFSIGQKNKTAYKKSAQINTQSKDTIIITKQGYISQMYSFDADNQTYPILKNTYSNLEYLDYLPNIDAFKILQSNPLSPVYGEVKSIKILYSIVDGKIYYSNSAKYNIHYDFAWKVLGYSKGQAVFNQEQYTNNENRIYYLANLNHFTASGKFTIEFFAGDEIDCNGIKTVYDKVAQSSFIKNSLRLYINNSKWEVCANVPIISSDELYEGQNYQPLNARENYGYLKNVDINELNKTYLGRHDIALLNGIPLNISVVAGIITTEFQTPLSHINVLSHNRGTPNMALRDGWVNPKLNKLVGKLVYLKVGFDSFYIREANFTEAQQFWSAREPKIPQILKLDTLTNGIFDISNISIKSVATLGGKVANMGELAKIMVKDYGPLPIPEGACGIPFSYYWQHLRKYGLHEYIDSMLTDTSFWKEVTVRQAKLKKLADSIKNCPLDTNLIRLITQKLTATGFTTFRFRSSTNAEDIKGFNGAGLYDSYTGTLNNPDKPIDKAIKKTWASLWNFQAFEERDYFKIDHRNIAMGILVNRSYPAEAANGVVITQNIYNPANSAITINVQIGEISIVSPEENYLPDQILYYTFRENAFEYLSHSTVPGMKGKTVMTNEELKVLKDYCMAVHYHYCRLNFECKPMDIEFKVDLVNGQRKIYIKQARLY